MVQNHLIKTGFDAAQAAFAGAPFIKKSLQRKLSLLQMAKTFPFNFSNYEDPRIFIFTVIFAHLRLRSRRSNKQLR
jgi:hypothetical protein